MKLRASCFAVAALAALSHPAAAFDCAKASTAVETAICADPDLKRLDDKLSEAYGVVKAASSKAEQKMLARSQKRWITSREYCTESEAGVSACVKDETAKRLRLLTGAPASGPGASGRIIPVFIVQEGTEKLYDLDIAVLRFAAPQAPGERRLNEIAEDITGRVRLGPHGEDTMGSIYGQQEDMDITHASGGLMSVLHSYYLNQGGAHGNGGIQNFNIDMKSGELIEIGDLLAEPAAAGLAGRCKEQIIAAKRERFETEPYDPATDDFLKDDVIGEHIATLSRWSISAREITITFDPYAIGSYAEGPYECIFPTAG